MGNSNWRKRILTSTRGRVLSLLRMGPRTVNELADALALTDNAVRTHLSALERDGLIRQEGVRRAIGKPAFVYVLADDAEALFPKGYAEILDRLLDRVRRDQGDRALEAFLRNVGRDAAGAAPAATGSLRERIDAAVVALGALGGLAEVEEREDEFYINGFSCPLSAIVTRNPEACALAEQLVTDMVGATVTECCDRSHPPRCRFRVAKARE
ncbi:MAG TPA: ArsR family transcriptional regulator [Longimicrobiales bacterium]|nr:ArsR family transcriptional regulator [Longimicrobiales bacterium]